MFKFLARIAATRPDLSGVGEIGRPGARHLGGGAVIRPVAGDAVEPLVHQPQHLRCQLDRNRQLPAILVARNREYDVIVRAAVGGVETRARHKGAEMVVDIGYRVPVRSEVDDRRGCETAAAGVDAPGLIRRA